MKHLLILVVLALFMSCAKEEFTEFMTYYHDQEKLFTEQLKNSE